MSRDRRPFRSATCFAVAAALAGCGSHSAPPTAPAIRDLEVEPHAVYAAPMPTTLTVSWQFDDPNGDVDAAVVTITDAANVVVDQQTFDVAAQSHAGSLLVTSPIVTLPDLGSYSVAVELIDRAGHRSNPLSQAVEVSQHPWQLISGYPLGTLVDVGLGTLADRIYAVGGVQVDPPGWLGPPLSHDDSLPFVCAFEPAVPTWAFLADLPRARQGVVAVPWNAHLYAIGGWEYWRTVLPENPRSSNAVVGTVEEFDPVAGTWTQRTAMPTPRRLAAGALLGGVIVVVGGETVPPARVPLDTVEVYVPFADLWTTWPRMPRARSRCRAAALGGKLYVAGGHDSANGCETAVDVFDPLTGLWTTAPQTPGCATLLVALGDRLVAATGTTLVSNSDPDSGEWHTLTECPVPIDDRASAAVHDGKLLVLRGGDLWRYDPALEVR